ncbi:DUF833-domain-containing protein [Aureobasidium sp. EXF-10728]|nr:DUF833-domain-containing protein [Aureobasidium sp. EXF-10728]
MCIALLTTAHPDYPFILLNNRDEFLTRPTAKAAFWPSPNEHVLGGRDLQRPEQGTWLGLTKQGRLACLTNFRESGAQVYGTKSRGGLPKAFLTQSPQSTQSSQEFARHMVEDVGVSDVGGFSLVFGKLSKRNICAKNGEGLAIISNRIEDASATTWICGKPGEIRGLSNSHYGDRTWPKVVEGEKQLHKAILEHTTAGSSKEDLLKSFFGILSMDTLPRRKHGQDWETYVYQLRNSIFIPRIGGENLKDSSADEIAAADVGHTAKTDNGTYGTQKQTVILVDHDGKVTYVEKTLYDEHGNSTDNDVQQYEFEIEGWKD